MQVEKSSNGSPQSNSGWKRKPFNGDRMRSLVELNAEAAAKARAIMAQRKIGFSELVSQLILGS